MAINITETKIQLNLVARKAWKSGVSVVAIVVSLISGGISAKMPLACEFFEVPRYMKFLAMNSKQLTVNGDW